MGVFFQTVLVQVAAIIMEVLEVVFGLFQTVWKVMVLYMLGEALLYLKEAEEGEFLSTMFPTIYSMEL